MSVAYSKISCRLCYSQIKLQCMWSWHIKASCCTADCFLMTETAQYNCCPTLKRDQPCKAVVEVQRYLLDLGANKNHCISITMTGQYVCQFAGLGCVTTFWANSACSSAMHATVLLAWSLLHDITLTTSTRCECCQ